MKSPVYVVILAGGDGKRLWPLSTHAQPKQLLPFRNGKTLLQETIERAHTLAKKEHCWVVTSVEQQEQIQTHCGDSVGTVLAEPIAKNTAAAMLLAARKIAEQNKNATLVFLPSDHYIADTHLFAEFITHAIDAAKNTDTIVLLGLKPSYPATGYGYIAHDGSDTLPCTVRHFYEKPTEMKAIEYVHNGFLWNSGMFVATVKTFLKECKEHASLTYNAISAHLNGHATYKDITPLSIDYAVMEKSKKCSVIPVDFVWSDVGNLYTFLSLSNQQDAQKVVQLHAKNNLVQAKQKVVALIGVDNLCVAQTDDALVITDRRSSEKVKEVLAILEKEKNRCI